ncbi:MAG: hypothetical protein H0T47_11765 [Planctomycetaceae bacterium]|nr:hypothetical protein [Planctomycetaceae bacterium]
MRRLLSLSLLAFGMAAVTAPGTADAHDRFGGYGYGGYGYGGGFGGYYGNGGHDFQPHWHTTRSQFGSYQWFGNGPHDYAPHHHTYSPWSYEGHHVSPFGVTTSHYPRYPYYYAPW